MILIHLKKLFQPEKKQKKSTDIMKITVDKGQNHQLRSPNGGLFYYKRGNYLCKAALLITASFSVVPLC